MSFLYQLFLASVISEHGLAALRSHKLLLLFLSVLFVLFSYTTLSLPQPPLHSLFYSSAYVLEGRVLFSDEAYIKPACRWKGCREACQSVFFFACLFLRTAYLEFKFSKRSPMIVLLSSAFLHFPHKFLLNTVPMYLVLPAGTVHLLLLWAVCQVKKLSSSYHPLVWLLVTMWNGHVAFDGLSSIRIKFAQWKWVTYLIVCSSWIHYCPLWCMPFNIPFSVVFVVCLFVLLCFCSPSPPTHTYYHPPVHCLV